MADSIRDQLIKIGLVDEKKAAEQDKQAREQRARRKRQGQGGKSADAGGGKGRRPKRPGKPSRPGQAEGAANKNGRNKGGQNSGQGSKPNTGQKAANRNDSQAGAVSQKKGNGAVAWSSRETPEERGRRQKEEKKAIRQRVQQIIREHRKDRSTAEVAYYFREGKKVRQLYVTDEIRDGLAEGKMDIVQVLDVYDVVDSEVAEKIAQMRPSALVPRPEGKVEEDEWDAAMKADAKSESAAEADASNSAEAEKSSDAGAEPEVAADEAAVVDTNDQATGDVAPEAGSAEEESVVPEAPVASEDFEQASSDTLDTAEHPDTTDTPETSETTKT